VSFVFPEFVFNKDILLYVVLALMSIGVTKMLYHGIRIRWSKTRINP